MADKKIGQYIIKERIGKGGMANVFLGYDSYLEREVAIKVLDAYFAREPAFASRFDREAKTITGLEHSHIVPLYDFGNFRGLPYLVMRYMKGGSLGKRLEQGTLSIAEASQIIKRVAAALDYAHKNGIIHRDLKPDNILFDLENNAFLADFGIVKIAESSTTYTQTGNTLGTPAYMSPEQAIAQKELDGRSDLYSLGIILYEMLTGDIPYKADTNLGQAMMHIREPVPEILQVKPELPTQLDTVIKKALAKEREERYATVGEFAAALEAVVHSEDGGDVSDTFPSEAVVPPLQPEMRKPQSKETAVQETPLPVQGLQKETAIETPSVQHGVTTDAEEPNNKMPLWMMAGLGLLLIAITAVGFLIWQNNSRQNEEVISITQTARAIALSQTETAVASTPDVDPTSTATPTSAPTDHPTATPTSIATHTPTAAPPTIGSTFVRARDNMTMVFVPNGTFAMGSDPANDPNSNDDETPQRQVSLDGFWIDSTEVTNAQFSQFVEATNYVTTAEEAGSGTVFTGANFVQQSGADWQHPTGSSSSISGLNNHPVVMVSWYDAAAYCEWAGGQLPTEAQWEYAARGRQSLRFPWGNEWPSCNAAEFGDCINRTLPVGSLSPTGDSWVGASDMAGNVWEWVDDWYDENYYANAPAENPLGASGGDKKIHKGGSWGSNPVLLRSAFRGDNEPEKRFDLVGFRCMMPDS